jgi:hypothetical protein
MLHMLRDSGEYSCTELRASPSNFRQNRHNEAKHASLNGWRDQRGVATCSNKAAVDLLRQKASDPSQAGRILVIDCALKSGGNDIQAVCAA